MKHAGAPKESADRMLILHITDRCNLACNYCYASKSGRREMTPAVAKQAVRWALRRFGARLTIVFIGGEPLLRMDLIREVTSFARAAGITRFIVPTNGTGFDGATARFFEETGISPTFHFFTLAGARRLMSLIGENRPAWANKTNPDPPRMRFNLIPGQVRKTFRNISSLLRHPASDLFVLDIMPVMGGEYWRTAEPGQRCVRAIREGMLKLAGEFSDKFRRGEKASISVGECLSGRAAFLPPRDGGRLFCQSGLGKFSVDAAGDIYPCYLAAANPNDNREFVLGNVTGAKLDGGALRKFNGDAENRAFSCLYWNRRYTGDSGTPAGIYRSLAASLNEANSLIGARLSGKDPCNMKALRKMIFIKSEFGLKTDAQAEKLMTLLNRSEGAEFGSSHKVEGGVVRSVRFNILYEGSERGKAQGLLAVFAHLKDLASLPGVKLAASQAGRVVNRDLDLSKVWKIGLGTDFREDARKSRIKLWLFVKNYPQLSASAAGLAEKYGAKALPGGQRLPFVFGLDLGLDGRVSVKYYTIYEGADLKKLVGKTGGGIFSGKILALAKECDKIYVAARNRGESVFIFFPKAPADFLARLGIAGITALDARCRKGGSPALGISLREHELLRGKPETCTLYY